jgi:hypothetical protein
MYILFSLDFKFYSFFFFVHRFINMILEGNFLCVYVHFQMKKLLIPQLLINQLSFLDQIVDKKV